MMRRPALDSLEGFWLGHLQRDERFFALQIASKRIT